MLFLCDSDAKQSHQTVCSVAASWLSLPEAVTWFLSCVQEISSPVKSLLPISTFWPESFTTGLRRSAWRCWGGSTTPANQVSLREQVSLRPSTSTSDPEQKDETNQIDLSEHFHTFSVLSVFVRRPVRRRRPAGGSHAVWEPAGARHGSDLLPQHAGAGGGPRAPAVRVHPHAHQDRLPQRAGVSDRQVVRRHPRRQMSSDGNWDTWAIQGLERWIQHVRSETMVVSLSAHDSQFMILFFKARTVTNLQDWSCC